MEINLTTAEAEVLTDLLVNHKMVLAEGVAALKTHLSKDAKDLAQSLNQLLLLQEQLTLVQNILSRFPEPEGDNVC